TLDLRHDSIDLGSFGRRPVPAMTRRVQPSNERSACCSALNVDPRRPSEIGFVWPGRPHSRGYHRGGIVMGATLRTNFTIPRIANGFVSPRAITTAAPHRVGRRPRQPIGG